MTCNAGSPPSALKKKSITVGDIFRLKKKGNDLDNPLVLSNSATEGVVVQSEYFDKAIANSKNLSRYTVVNVGDFVYNPRVSNSAPCGPIKRNDVANGVVSPLYTVLEPVEEVDSDYLVHYFNSNVWNEYVLATANSGARHDRMNLSQKDIKRIPIAIPSLEEQRRIAGILSTWEKAINAYDRLIALKEKQKRGLMQDLFSNKGLCKHPSIRLGDFLTEIKLRNKDGCVERVLSVTNSRGFALPEEQFSRRVASKNTKNYKIVSKGQFGYNPSRLNVGSFARLDEFDVGLLSPMYVVFCIDDKVVDSDFFLQWMRSHEAKRQISNASQGSVRETVNFDSLKNMSIYVPSMGAQKCISKTLKSWDFAISTLKKKRDLLKKQKQGLMQQLLA